MTRIEGEKVLIKKSQVEIFAFLSNFNNFKVLMPEQVTNWESTEDECKFTIAGMATLGMKINEKIPFSLIKVERHGQAPFDFTLDCAINNSEPGSCIVQLVFHADLNPMLKMMAVKPLTNFLNILTHKLEELPTSGHP
jgi:hypothetical protein